VWIFSVLCVGDRCEISGNCVWRYSWEVTWYCVWGVRSGIFSLLSVGRQELGVRFLCIGRQMRSLNLLCVGREVCSLRVLRVGRRMCSFKVFYVGDIYVASSYFVWVERCGV